MNCAQSGILFIGVKIPLISINIKMKNRKARIACCAFDDIFEIINPNAVNAVRYEYINKKLPFGKSP